MILLGSILFAIVFTLLFFFLGVTWYWLILIFLGSFIVYTLLFVGVLYIITFFHDTNKVVIKPKRFYGWMIYEVCVLLKRVLRINIISEGFEKIKGLKGYTMVCNHQAIIDPICYLLASKEKGMSFIVKKEVRKMPLVGRWFAISGYYFLNRDNSREGLKTIINGTKALKENRPVGIYVEGTRSKGANLGEFHEGSFKMPQKANAPIVLCCIDKSYLMKKNYPLKKTNVYLKVCEVIPYEKYQDMTTKEIASYAHSVVSQGLKEIREKYR